jgi:hypothetical protein
MGAYIFDENSGTVLVPCRFCGKRELFRVNPSHFRKWSSGEALIQVALPNLSKEKRELLLSNTCPKCWDKYIVSEARIPQETEADEQKEECLYHPMVLDPNVDLEHEVPNECYLNAMRDHSVGDKVRHFVSAPGTGFIEYMITRMDETGVYAIKLLSTVRELTPEEVR